MSNATIRTCNNASSNVRFLRTSVCIRLGGGKRAVRVVLSEHDPVTYRGAERPVRRPIRAFLEALCPPSKFHLTTGGRS